MIFFAPAYPLEELFDPTGAGDAFAGGFLGYLAQVGEVTPDAIPRLPSTIWAATPTRANMTSFCTAHLQRNSTR